MVADTGCFQRSLGGGQIGAAVISHKGDEKEGKIAEAFEKFAAE